MWIFCVVLTNLYSYELFARSKSEASYQKEFCKEQKGIEEYQLDDGTRVDCLNKDYAIEIDFADKWYEAIGQSLHYSRKTGRKPGIAIILDDLGHTQKFTSMMKVIEKFKLPIKVFKIRGGIFEKKQRAKGLLTDEGITEPPNKKSRSGICHEKNSRHYAVTKKF